LGNKRESKTVHPSEMFNKRAKFISCGLYCTGLIDLEDNLWMFGDNQSGQLGLRNDTQNIYVPEQVIWNQENKAKSISCGYSHTAMIDLNDNVWMFGGNNHGELGLGDYSSKYVPTSLVVPGTTILFKAKSVVCGYDFTMFGVSELIYLVD
jgi:X-linked retinitis pigmentosa GTPase regulator